MIFGIGTDIVEVDRFRDSKTKMDSLAKRICTEYELAEYDNQTEIRKPTYVAKKWATKEAIAKAFGTGIRGVVKFKSMEIRHQENGKPYVCFYSDLGDMVKNMNLKCHLSISDTDSHVVAYALAEYSEPVNINN